MFSSEEMAIVMTMRPKPSFCGPSLSRQHCSSLLVGNVLWILYPRLPVSVHGQWALSKCEGWIAEWLSCQWRGCHISDWYYVYTDPEKDQIWMWRVRIPEELTKGQKHQGGLVINTHTPHTRTHKQHPTTPKGKILIHSIQYLSWHCSGIVHPPPPPQSSHFLNEQGKERCYYWELVCCVGAYGGWELQNEFVNQIPATRADSGNTSF